MHVKSPNSISVIVSGQNTKAAQETDTVVKHKLVLLVVMFERGQYVDEYSDLH